MLYITHTWLLKRKSRQVGTEQETISVTVVIDNWRTSFYTRLLSVGSGEGEGKELSSQRL